MLRFDPSIMEASYKETECTFCGFTQEPSYILSGSYSRVQRYVVFYSEEQHLKASFLVQRALK